MELGKFFKLLYKFKWVLVLLPLVAVLITYFLVRKLPDTYKSHARISTGIVDQSQNILNNPDQSQEMVIQQKFNNLIEIARLKRIFDQVSFQLIVHDMTSDKPFRKPSKKMIESGPQARAHALEVYREHIQSKEPLSLFDKDQFGINELLRSMDYDEPTLQSKISIYRINGSDFIDVDYESEDPYLSAFVVNVLVKEFIDYYSNYIRGNQLKAVNFLDNLMRQKYDSMNAKMQLLRDYKIKNRVLNLSEQASSLYAQITDFDSRYQQALGNVASFESAIKGIDSKFDPVDRRYLESKMVEVNQSIIQLREQLKAVTNELIRSNYDPLIKAKHDSLKSKLEGQIQLATDRLIVSPLANKQLLIQERIRLEIQLDQAKAGLNTLREEIKLLNEKFDALVPHEALIQNYEGSVQVAGKEYLDIQDKFNKTSLESTIGIQLRQIETAMPAPPLPSKKLLLVVLSGLVSLVFCLMVLFLVFYFDHSIQTPEDLANMTGDPVLAFLPKINTGLISFEHLWKEENASRHNTAFKHLLRSLRFEAERELGSNVSLAITSLKQGEGKTLVAIGLAYAFSMVHKKVLLIDGHFERPAITEQLDPQFFIEDFLKSRIGIADFFQDNQVVVLGNRGGDASLFELSEEALTTPKLAQLRDAFDVIIIETPELSSLNKAREWVTLTDKVLVVFQHGFSLRNGAKQQLKFLQSLGAKMSGWVLNKVYVNRLEKLPK
ncbi:MAG: lipopolysaccharide biosynthesis protein [Sphingobacteriia bacterium]|nr:MAG: lipopolysaccharide biosynthesis protein [Sphingobacteriia bacterium]